MQTDNYQNIDKQGNILFLDQEMLDRKENNLFKEVTTC